MRTWLRWASLGACAGVIAIGCGGSSGGTNDFVVPGDDASGHDGNGGEDATTDDGGDDATGDDADAGEDATAVDTGPAPIDATLDIGFPDSFYGPDVSESGADAPSDAPADGADSGCMPNGITCSANIAQICNNGNYSTQNCALQNKVCADGFGCVVCQPGTGSCNGNVGTVCKNDGSGYATNNCDPQLGETCANGLCVGDCASVGTSYIGCEYFAVTMSNHWLSQANPPNAFYFSISVSNTSSKTANIIITGPNAYSKSDTIPAGGIKEYGLPWVSQLSMSSWNLTTRANGGSYHLKSTEPVTVYQFNPRDYTLNGASSYTNDASLLIPVNAMTGNYRVLNGATWYWSGGVQLPGHVDIIATANNTQVTYTAPNNNPIIAGAGLATTGGTVTLNQGDVLQIASAQNASSPSTYASDQSGALIAASAPVEVFGGSDCTNTPAAIPYCDHIEEINFPIETLRNDYLVTVPYNANATPRHFVKIVGTANNTSLTYDPNIGAPATVQAGQAIWFETTQHFHVTANNPITVGSFMEGQNAFGGGCANTQQPNCGDPALSLSVATAQFRKDYQFIAPQTYAENWVNIVAPNGATITVDGNQVPNNSFVAIGNSGYGVARMSLCGNNSCNGVHKASGNQAFGIAVYGYGAYTSYMYPGGLNLTRQ